jgi:hypothetical protein
MKIYRLAYEVPESSSPYWTEVDKNTLIIGKIKSANQAKKLIKNLPRLGHETVVDKGIVNLKYEMDGSRQVFVRDDENGLPREYKTYLQNNAGRFRVWTYILPPSA